ncbi:MAG: caspase family protein [Blastocatellia bacterium]
MRRSTVFVFCVAALSGFFGRPHAAQQSVKTIDNPAPFAIELPEPGINTGVLHAVNHTDIYIPPKQTVTRIILWVLQPYDQRFGYNFKASLNSKALATVSTKGSGRYGNFLDVDLRQQPDLRLTPGRNFVEITATETESGLTYRCSFVLMPETSRDPRPAPAPVKPEIRFEQVLAAPDSFAPNDDRAAPQLTLTEPAAAPAAAAAPFTVRLVGSARDDSGVVSAISVNGRIIAQPPPPRDEKKKKDKKEKEAPPPPPLERKLDFDHTLTVGADTYALLLEARDITGNRALAHIPIVRPLGNNIFGGRQYALIVGVSHYAHHEGDLNDLSFADKDAEAVRDWMQTGGGGGFKAEDIVCLTNNNATLSAVRNFITRFLTTAGPNDLIYLFLAGHGASDPYDPRQYYFLLHDSKVNNLRDTAFPMTELGKFLDEQSKQTRLIAFFDTCHSAGVNRQPIKPAATSQPAPPKQTSTPKPKDNRGVGSKKSGASEPTAKGVGSKKSEASGAGNTGGNRPPTVTLTVSPDFNFYNTELFKQRGWTVITSSALTEESREGPKWAGPSGNGHGVFTWALLKGARGEADADGDCRITAAELFNYVKGVVSRETGGEQNPQTMPGASGDLVIASVPAANCRRGERK